MTNQPLMHNQLIPGVTEARREEPAMTPQPLTREQVVVHVTNLLTPGPAHVDKKATQEVLSTDAALRADHQRVTIDWQQEKQRNLEQYKMNDELVALLSPYSQAGTLVERAKILVERLDQVKRERDEAKRIQHDIANAHDAYEMKLKADHAASEQRVKDLERINFDHELNKPVLQARVTALEEALKLCIEAWKHDGEPSAIGYEWAIEKAQQALATAQGKE